ncbi:MAG: hypothetical protein KGH69_05505, partial [Candidatus Micrarchaeota archaeon]|nr:hypothetical protein [Candidatus Micrarchaeota archaeon]
MFDGVKAGNRSKVILAVSVIATVILVCLYIAASRSSFLPQKSVQSAVALTIIAVAIVEAMKRAIFYYFLNTVNKAEAKTLSELF